MKQAEKRWVVYDTRRKLFYSSLVPGGPAGMTNWSKHVVDAIDFRSHRRARQAANDGYLPTIDHSGLIPVRVYVTYDMIDL